MFDALRGWVLRLFRVPAEPAPPAGGRVIRVFRAAPSYFRYRLTLWALGQLGALLGLVAGLFFLSLIRDEGVPPLLLLLFRAAEVLAWTAYVVQLPLSFAVLRLDLEMRWYILSDRSLRIREGILSVREKTMTFANIQQISIRQNPLQRLLQIADVQVRTAGGGGGEAKGQVGEAMHEAFFRGVDNAEEIRTAIRERVRLHRDAGLGDPDEPPPQRERGHGQALAAARELQREMRELRRALVPGKPAG